MSDQGRAIDMIRQMPDAKPFDEIPAELYFREKVERGLRDEHDSVRIIAVIHGARLIDDLIIDDRDSR